MNKLRFAFALLLVTCGGCNWHGPHYLGRYEVDGTDGHRFLVDTVKNQTVIDENVLDIETSDHYAFVLRELARSYECGTGKSGSIYTDYVGQLEYWVIDASTGEIVGPLDMGRYESYLKSHSLPDAELKQKYYYAPPSDYSPKMRDWLQKSCTLIGP